MDAKLPPKVYGTTILQGLLDEYWTETQKTIFIYHLIPFVLYVVLSIIHFTSVLAETDGTEEGAEANATMNWRLSFVLFPFWAFLLICEML